jgi:hypothetical protein
MDFEFPRALIVKLGGESVSGHVGNVRSMFLITSEIIPLPRALLLALGNSFQNVELEICRPPRVAFGCPAR